MLTIIIEITISIARHLNEKKKLNNQLINNYNKRIINND